MQADKKPSLRHSARPVGIRKKSNRYLATVSVYDLAGDIRGTVDSPDFWLTSQCHEGAACSVTALIFAAIQSGFHLLNPKPFCILAKTVDIFIRQE